MKTKSSDIINNQGPHMNQKNHGSDNIPKLRFPEFRDTGEWTYLNGNKVFDQISNKNHNSDLPILAITQEYGAIPRDQIDYTVIVTDKSVESYKVVEVGDFIISLRSFQGGIEYSNYKGLCSPAYIILRKRKDVKEDFYKQYFKSKLLIQDLNRNIEGIRDGKMVSYKQFSEILLPKPEPQEQQKIAYCLSSLDELISAHTQKLDALIAHKKGLMQQLFPIEGETLPKLRFRQPNGQPFPKWEEVKLSTLVKLITRKNKSGLINRVLTNSAVNGIMDQRDYFEKDIANKNNLEGYYIIEYGDYVYNPRTSTSAPVGPISKNKIGTGVMSPLYTIFRFINNDNDFFEQYFKTSHWHKYLRMISNSGARHDRMSISINNFMDMPLPYPNPIEQQKIADCLSSIDQLIKTQNLNLNALKTLKKGLMQGLFPNLNVIANE